MRRAFGRLFTLDGDPTKLPTFDGELEAKLKRGSRKEHFGPGDARWVEDASRGGDSVPSDELTNGDIRAGYEMYDVVFQNGEEKGLLEDAPFQQGVKRGDAACCKNELVGGTERELLGGEDLPAKPQGSCHRFGSEIGEHQETFERIDERHPLIDGRSRLRHVGHEDAP